MAQNTAKLTKFEKMYFVWCKQPFPCCVSILFRISGFFDRFPSLLLKKRVISSFQAFKIVRLNFNLYQKKRNLKLPRNLKISISGFN